VLAVSSATKSYFSRTHLISVSAIVAFVIAWTILSHLAPSYAVPYWSKIIKSLVEIPYTDVLITLVRLLISMVLSFVIGLACSLLLFERPDFEAFFLPLIKLLMAVPAVCWVVFAILWFRGVETRIYFVMLVTCGPVFAIDSLDAMKGVPNDLKQMARSFRPTNLQVLRTVIIPGIGPNLLTRWKINLTLAGAVNGIGHGLVLAQEMFSISDVFAWTIVLVAILYALQGVVSLAEHRLLRWRAEES
jgi:NitT/TauT family transport system permease protein